jgi:hypothetical protein
MLIATTARCPSTSLQHEITTGTCPSTKREREMLKTETANIKRQDLDNSKWFSLQQM